MVKIKISDQNPIENMCGILPRRVYAENRQYQTLFYFQEVIIDEWRSIDEDLRIILINSVMDKIFELIQNKGGPTHYL